MGVPLKWDVPNTRGYADGRVRGVRRSQCSQPATSVGEGVACVGPRDDEVEIVRSGSTHRSEKTKDVGGRMSTGYPRMNSRDGGARVLIPSQLNVGIDSRNVR